MAFDVIVNVTDVTCKGDSDGLLMVSNIQNGTTPYSYLWSTGITGTVANNLSEGSYQLTITDSNGCPFENSYAVGVENNIQASFSSNNVSSINLNDGSIDVIPAGGTAPYSFLWSNGSTNQNLTNAGLGTYSVTITDSNGCSEFFDQLTIGNGCMLSITQQNNPSISSQVYQVEQYIRSNGMVDISRQVSFKAGDYIELTNDFEVIQGAEFDAIIDGCE